MNILTMPSRLTVTARALAIADDLDAQGITSDAIPRMDARQFPSERVRAMVYGMLRAREIVRQMAIASPQRSHAAHSWPQTARLRFSGSRRPDSRAAPALTVVPSRNPLPVRLNPSAGETRLAP